MQSGDLALTLLVAVIAISIRLFAVTLSAKMSYLSSKEVKQRLRQMIYEKLLRLGTSYKEQVKTSEVVQVAVEGVDQLETYFGSYLPQFFYAMIAPLTLYIVLCFVSVPCAVVLLICVPLIPVSIVVVQRWAKKLLAKYWGQYTALGDTFLENLQGLTTLKIYQADDFKQKEMNAEAEKFRKITMKVLTMQLNSITIMDLVAYGGAALGVILSVTQYRAGNITMSGCLICRKRKRKPERSGQTVPLSVRIWTFRMKKTVRSCMTFRFRSRWAVLFRSWVNPEAASLRLRGF